MPSSFFNIEVSMNNISKITKGFFIAGLLAVSSLASADWTVSGGYSNYSEDDGADDISLNVIYAGVGYEFQSGNVTFMPELRYGVGVGDDKLYGVTVEVDSFFSASIRGQYNVTDTFAVFLQPAYSRLEVTASVSNRSFTEDEWEFGIGGGAAFVLSEKFQLEALYENYDGSNVFSFGGRYKF
jgi:hypothetical protein